VAIDGGGVKSLKMLVGRRVKRESQLTRIRPPMGPAATTQITQLAGA
jgi:hypothetical protein